MEKKRYRIISPDSPFFGLVGTCEMIYYDHRHTGDSPDMVQLRLEDGRGVRMFSTSVEEVVEEPAAAAAAGQETAEGPAAAPPPDVAALQARIAGLEGKLATKAALTNWLREQLDQVLEERDRLIESHADIRLLLIGLRAYLLQHDINIGECVPWICLKQRFAIAESHEAARAEFAEWDAHKRVVAGQRSIFAPVPDCPEHERPLALAGGAYICLVPSLIPEHRCCSWNLTVGDACEYREEAHAGA